ARRRRRRCAPGTGSDPGSVPGPRADRIAQAPGRAEPRVGRASGAAGGPGVRRWVLAFLPSLALVLAASAIGAQVGGADVVDAHVDRVLVVSFPGVSWSEVQARDLPNLKAFVAESAIGDLSTRIGRNRASTTDAYLSIGAGTRSVAPDVDVAVALDPDETYAGVRTADILERRLGRVPNGLAYLAVGAAIDRNETSS